MYAYTISIYNIYIYIYLVVIPWAQKVCLIYTPKAQGPQAQGCIYQVNHKCTWYNYYVTLFFNANGFTIFIVVLIAFDCGFRL